MLSKGKMENLTPRQAKTRERIDMKFCTRHYVVGLTTYAKNGEVPISVRYPSEGVTLTLKKFRFLKKILFVSSPRPQVTPINVPSRTIHQNACSDSVRCLWEVLLTNFQIWGCGDRKTPKFWPEIGKSHCKKHIKITRKRCKIDEKLQLTTKRKPGSLFQNPPSLFTYSAILRPNGDDVTSCFKGNAYYSKTVQDRRKVTIDH